MKSPFAETGENDAMPDDYTPEEMQRFSGEPATKLFVVEDRRRSCGKCSVRRWVSRAKLRVAFWVGVG